MINFWLSLNFGPNRLTKPKYEFIWKWQVTVFQLAMVSEFVITLYYWIMIWDWSTDTVFGGDPNKGLAAVL